MNKCSVAKLLLSTLVRQCIDKRQDNNLKYNGTKEKSSKCTGFLCTGCLQNLANLPPTLCLYSLMYVSVNTAMDPLDVIIPALKHDVNWSNYLDRQQVMPGCSAVIGKIWFACPV